MIRLSVAVVAVVLIAAGDARAEDCSLRGTVQTENGTPLTDVRVTVARVAGFKRFIRQVTTSRDGTFAVPDVPCGGGNRSTAGRAGSAYALRQGQGRPNCR